MMRLFLVISTRALLLALIFFFQNGQAETGASHMAHGEDSGANPPGSASSGEHMSHGDSSASQKTQVKASELKMVQGEAFGTHMSHGDHSGPDASDPQPVSVSVDFSARATEDNGVSNIQAGANFRVQFTISDPQTGKGVSYLTPAAWMKLRKQEGYTPDQETCESMIKTFQRTGILTVPADVDLSGFSILTVNDDNSVGIYNPNVNLKTSNLQALIPFEGEPGQWSLDQDNGQLFVSLPGENKLAVANIRLLNLQGYVGVGKQPRQLLMHANSPYLWVGNDGSGTVSVVDRASLTVVHTLEVGQGSVELALAEDGRFLFAGTSAEGRVSIIDIAKMKEVGRVTLGAGKLSLAYSSQRKTLFVGHEKLGELTMIDPMGKSATGMEIERGISSLTISPDGRFILALIPEKQKLTVIEVETNRVIGDLPTEEDPDLVDFSPDYVYVRNFRSPNVTVIELAGLDNPATAPVAHVPIGVVAPASTESLPGVSTMAPMHHGGHALIVNPADNRIYMYMEGMMAPMNSFKVYTRRPLGIMLYDRTLKEGAIAGRYESVNVVEAPGVYDVPFYLAEPQTAKCFELVIAADPTREKKKEFTPVFTEMFSDHIFLSGEKSRLRFKFHDAVQDQMLADIKGIVVMAVLQGSHYQHRVMASHLQDGEYEAAFKFPKAGKYHILIEAPSLGISFGDIRPTQARVKE